MHTLQFGRQSTNSYPPSILLVHTTFNRPEQQVDLSIGQWKQELQKLKQYVPELTPLKESGHEYKIKQLRSAMKNHSNAWHKWERKDDGIHFDRHEQFQHMQNVYLIPPMYQEPNE